MLGDFQPAEAAVEQTFVNKDGVATLKLGQARGVAMLAPAMFGISVAEYAPNQVKKTVVGAGHADKNQILVMLKILLPRAEPKSADAADALAIAITHAHHRGSAALRLKVVGRMIGKLKGLINSYGEDFVILDVGGVGYQVHCSARTLQALPSPGEAARAVDRNLCPRRSDKAVRLSQRRRARMVPAAADRAGRRRQGGAGGALDPAAVRSRQRHRAARQGGGDAHARASARRSPSASSPN